MADGGLSSSMRAKIETIARCAASAGPAVIDVGCGDGAFWPHLKRAGAKPSSYLGLDLSERMIRIAAAAHPGPHTWLFLRLCKT